MISDTGSIESFYKKEFKVPHEALRNSLKEWETDSTISFKGLRADSAIHELLIAQDWNLGENLDNIESLSIIVNSDKTFTKVFSSNFPNN